MKIKRRYRKVKKRYPKVLLTMTLVLTILLIPFNILASGASAGFTLGAGEVAEVNGTGYSTLGEALSAWTAGSTLKLLSDVTTDSTINVPSGEHTLDLNGCGIKMTGSGMVINVGGGAVLNLNDSNTNATHRFDVPDGAGLASLNEASGTYTVNGGYITGGNETLAGGVYILDNGTFNMYGGCIIGNKANLHGGGVDVSAPGTKTAVFNMYGGSICYNSSPWGGGINVFGTAYVNEGCTIHHNTASNGGAGIELESGGKLYLNGSTVTENVVLSQNGGMWKGGGVHVPNGTECHLQGAVQIKDNYRETFGSAQSNVFVRREVPGKVILDSALTSNASIGVGTNGDIPFTVTSAYGTYHGTNDPSKFFKSDYSDYIVNLNNSEIEVINKPVASVTSGGSTAYYSDLSSALSAWTEGSTLKLYSDVITTTPVTVPTGEHTFDLNGYGILMTGNDRVITINQGASLVLNDSDPDRIHYITLTNYRGTAVSDSGEESVSNGNGVIKVTGGYLTGGYRNNSGSHDRCGAGVYNWGTFVMNGGSIVGNTLFNNSGGGIRNSGYFTMNGGTIAFNYASGNGGGVTTYVPGGSQGKMTMNGGEISDNYCGSYGGGIQIAGPIEITGGSVTRNTAGAGGSGIFYDGKNDRFKLSGDPVIKDNSNNDDLYLGANATFMINGSLTEDADIHVLMNTPAEFTVGWKNIMGNADPSKYFTSNNSGYAVILNNNGEAEIGTPPVASVISGGTTTNYSSLSDAVNAWTAGSTLRLNTDATTSSTITVPSGEHTLDLNGHNLKASATGYSVVTVGSGAELTIYDTAGKDGKITGGSVGQNYGGGITVDGGTLTLKGGAVSGNANTYGGIGNCGGGVHVRNGGKFYMEGGEISGNTSYVGGGICTDSSATTVSITGGIIKNNKTERFGSAVWAGRNSSSIFRVGGNVQIIDNISTWTADKDGEASLNYVNALLLSGNPTVHGDWKTSGTSAPNSHINLDNDGSGVQRLTLEGALTNDTGTPRITMSPIYRWNDLKNGQTFVFTRNWNQYMGTAHPADYFKLDSGVSGVTVIRKDGEAAFTGSGDLGDLYITFDANDGDGKMDPQLTKTSSVTLNENTFSRKGWAFSGWNTKKDGSGTAYADKANISLSGDLTLYAQWKEPAASIISGETATDYGSLAEALNAWTAGSTLKLLSDVSNDTTITVPSGEHILDLNGHTLLELSTVGKFMVGSGTSSIANLTIIDSVGTGVIKHETGRPGSLIWIKEGSSLTLNGGTLEANSSASPVVDFFQQRNSSFTMNGGKITGTANNGAVRFGANCTFTMTGGEISGLQTSTGLFDFSVGSGGAINISGAPVVKNNTANGTVCNFNLPDGRLLNINGVMTDGASVGVTKVSKTGVLTNGWKANMGSADPSKYFTSDNSDYEVFMNRSGELEIGNNFVPDVSATGFEGSYDGKAHGITVSAPDGATIEYGTSEGSYTLTQSPTFTNAGTNTVYYKVSLGSYSPVFGSEQVKINQINATVTITGNNGTFDYDGKLHTISDYTAKADTKLYNVAKDFTFSGNAEVYRTNAGKSMMGLATNMFTNTNGNFKTVTFNITDGYITVSPINATITITGHNNTVDYNGSAHSADGYDAVANTALYDVTADFTYNGRAEAVRTNAGTTYMGLKAEKFENTNSNFKTVTFTVTDGYQKINPIDTTVTITGHNSTVNFDGKSHSVSGYDAAAGSELYDVTADFTFSGKAEAERTNAGTTAMGLASAQFENTNANFKTVTFNITDGYLTVNTVDAVITSKPRAKGTLVYSGSAQELIVAGTAEGGTFYYALGSNVTSAPADSQYKTSVPTGKDVGNYYIWYKVTADSNHNSLSPACVKITLAEKTWTTVNGIIHDDNNNPVSGATVSLTSGGKTVDTIISGNDGSYYFTASPGVYNIVVKFNGTTITDMVDISRSTTYNVSVSDANTDSVLDIVGTDSDIVVGGLNKEADAVRAKDNISSDKNVAVRMTVTPVSVGSTDAVSAIEEYAPEMNLEYYDLKVEKTVDSTTTYLDNTHTVLEIVIPCTFTNKQELTVYRADGSGVVTLTESNSGEAGTFRVDANAGLVYIYTNQNTTYAIGYKPYYSVSSMMSLGSFTGDIDVTLTKNGETIYELTGVPSDNVSFKGVPKGKYSMTITWTDGAENSLTTPFEIK